jgi:DNA (cytosine-5)-methyltransferase 1
VLTVGSLFAGIGGFDLGLERAGMRSVWQSEIDPYCQRVLAKHWPDVLRVPDVRDVGAGTVPYVDVICGGFPCQDISNAGKRAGIEGARSSLWAQFARVVGELRPRYVIVENVAALRGRGLDRVVAGLAEVGYDAEWDCLRASDFGARHRRNRLWLVAYAEREPLRIESGRGGGSCGAGASLAGLNGQLGYVADTGGVRRHRRQGGEGVGREAAERHEAIRDTGDGREPRRVFGCELPAPTWPTEPDVGRVADGVPARLDRLTALGNALVPQIAEWIGRRIVAYEAERELAAA